MFALKSEADENIISYSIIGLGRGLFKPVSKAGWMMRATSASDNSVCVCVSARGWVCVYV